MLLRRCTDRLFLRPDGALRGGRRVFSGKRLLLRARLPHRGRPARKKHPSRRLVPMNSAASTAGPALPDQASSKEDPFKMSAYPRNQRISNKPNRSPIIDRLTVLRSPSRSDLCLSQRALRLQRTPRGVGGSPQTQRGLGITPRKCDRRRKQQMLRDLADLLKRTGSCDERNLA